MALRMSTIPGRLFTMALNFGGINQGTTQFVWNKKCRKLIGSKEQGGGDMPDFQIISNALKVVWVGRRNESKRTSS